MSCNLVCDCPKCTGHPAYERINKLEAELSSAIDQRNGLLADNEKQAERVAELETAIYSMWTHAGGSDQIRSYGAVADLARKALTTRQDSEPKCECTSEPNPRCPKHPMKYTESVQKTCEHEWKPSKYRCEKCGEHVIEFAKNIQPSKINEATAQDVTNTQQICPFCRKLIDDCAGHYPSQSGEDTK